MDGPGAGGRLTPVGRHSPWLRRGAEQLHFLLTLKEDLPVLPLLWSHHKSWARVENLELLPSEEPAVG